MGEEQLNSSGGTAVADPGPSERFQMDDSLSDYPPVAHLGQGQAEATLRARLASLEDSTWHQRLPLWTFFAAGFTSVLAIGSSTLLLVKLVS